MYALKVNQLTMPLRWLMVVCLLAVPLSSFAQASSWNVKAGAQSPDCLAGGTGDAKLDAGCQARQAMAFIPNEIWIHQNDSISWTMATDENHTVTFLNQPPPMYLGVAPYPAAQQRPSNAVGCAAYGSAISPNGSAYDPAGLVGLQCVHSGAAAAGGALVNYGDTYTVRFPVHGNFKFTCLIHASMYGLVHVLDSAAALPYNQAAYNDQAESQQERITSALIPEELSFGRNRVFTVGKIVATGGGWQYGSLFRFVDAKGNIITKKSPLMVHVGQTVEFSNIDAAEPHTITFGCPTDDATCPVGGGPFAFVNVNDGGTQPSGTAADGTRFAVMNAPFHPADEGDRSLGDKSEINAGFLVAQSQDRATGVAPLSGTPGTSVALAQSSPSLNRFRVTLNATGMYRFICELHDQLGMIGWVNVVP